MRKFEEFKGSLGRIKIDRFVKSQIFKIREFFTFYKCKSSSRLENWLHKRCLKRFSYCTDREIINY